MEVVALVDFRGVPLAVVFFLAAGFFAVAAFRAVDFVVVTLFFAVVLVVRVVAAFDDVFFFALAALVPVPADAALPDVFLRVPALVLLPAVLLRADAAAADPLDFFFFVAFFAVEDFFAAMETLLRRLDVKLAIIQSVPDRGSTPDCTGRGATSF